MDRILLVIAAVTGTLALVVAAAWAMQRQLIFLPDRHRPDVATAGLEGLEEVRYRTADGLELAAWLAPAPRPDPVATVVVFPGNAGHRGYRTPLARMLNDLGCDVLLVDYRGYGGNPGRPSEDGLLADARAARDRLVARARTDPDAIVYFGESLGSAVAVALAAEHPPRGLVLRSPFGELADVGRLHYPFLPVRTLLRDRFETSAHLDATDVPTLVVVGTDDRIVPPALSTQVAEGAGARLIEVPGAHHNDPALLDGAVLRAAIAEFLADDLELPLEGRS